MRSTRLSVPPDPPQSLGGRGPSHQLASTPIQTRYPAYSRCRSRVWFSRIRPAGVEECQCTSYRSPWARRPPSGCAFPCECPVGMPSHRLQRFLRTLRSFQPSTESDELPTTREALPSLQRVVRSATSIRCRHSIGTWDSACLLWRLLVRATIRILRGCCKMCGLAAPGAAMALRTVPPCGSDPTLGLTARDTAAPSDSLAVNRANLGVNNREREERVLGRFRPVREHSCGRPVNSRRVWERA